MKRTRKFISCLIAIVMMISWSFSTYAQHDYIDLDRQAREMTVTNKQVGPAISSVTGVARGRLISSADVVLTNKGFGVAGLYGEVLCHQGMETIRIVLILQKWNEADETWDNINRQEFTWNASDLPEGEELSMAAISYDIAGMEHGETYRLRGLFGAYELNGTRNEAWNASTEGIIF